MTAGSGSYWSGFTQPDMCCVRMLLPTSSQFHSIAKIYYQKLAAVYGGTDHYYAVDSFNENLVDHVSPGLS